MDGRARSPPRDIAAAATGRFTLDGGDVLLQSTSERTEAPNDCIVVGDGPSPSPIRF